MTTRVAGQGDNVLADLGASDKRLVHDVRRTLDQFGTVQQNAEFEKALVRDSGPPELVVVGEVKRGKSTLVNALVGRPVTAPGVDVTTAVAVSIEPPSARLAEGWAEVVRASGTSRVTIEQSLEAQLRRTPGGAGGEGAGGSWV